MLKKYALFAALGILAVLTLSAFSSPPFQRTSKTSFSLAEFRLAALVPPPVYQYGPRNLATGFASGVPKQYEYGPFNLATGFAAGVPQQYEYGPRNLATGFAAGVPKQYQYGPASLATGFAAPSK
jgi:hypothetical protein